MHPHLHVGLVVRSVVQGIRGSLAQCTSNCTSDKIASFGHIIRPLIPSLWYHFKWDHVSSFCHLSTDFSWRPGHDSKGEKCSEWDKPCEKPDLTRSDFSLVLNHVRKSLRKVWWDLSLELTHLASFLILFCTLTSILRILCVRQYIFIVDRYIYPFLRTSSHPFSNFCTFLAPMVSFLWIVAWFSCLCRVIVTLLKSH